MSLLDRAKALLAYLVEAFQAWCYDHPASDLQAPDQLMVAEEVRDVIYRLESWFQASGNEPEFLAIAERATDVLAKMCRGD